jgi:hypothetical protein
VKNTLSGDIELTAIEQAIVRALVSAICADLRADAERDDGQDKKDLVGADDAGQARL